MGGGRFTAEPLPRWVTMKKVNNRVQDYNRHSNCHLYNSTTVGPIFLVPLKDSRRPGKQARRFSSLGS